MLNETVRTVRAHIASHLGCWFIWQTASFHNLYNFKAHWNVSNVKKDSVLCDGKTCFIFPGKWDFWRTDVKHRNIFSLFSFDTRRPSNQKVTLEPLQNVDYTHMIENVYEFFSAYAFESIEKIEIEEGRGCVLWYASKRWKWTCEQPFGGRKTFNMTWIMSMRVVCECEVREILIQILDSRTIDDGW